MGDLTITAESFGVRGEKQKRRREKSFGNDSGIDDMELECVGIRSLWRQHTHMMILAQPVTKGWIPPSFELQHDMELIFTPSHPATNESW